MRLEQTIDDGGGVTGFFTRGHVEKRRFVDELKRQWDVDVSIRKVHHEYWRAVPYRGVAYFDYIYYPAEPGKRGAFPVTTVSLVSKY